MTQTEYQVDLFENQTPPNSTIFVLGATGCGKTTLIANLLNERRRFIIIDTREEYPVEFFGAVRVKTVSEMVQALNGGVNRIIVSYPSHADDETVLNLICYQLIDFQKHNPGTEITIAMDELNRFVSSQSCPPGLKELIQRGRAHGVKKIFGAQWFNSIPTWTRDSFSEMYVFRHNEPRGLAMLECYGIPSAIVSELPPHTCVHFSGGNITTVKLIATNDKNATEQNKVVASGR